MHGGYKLKKALAQSETYYSYPSESNNWTESRLNGFHIYFSSKEYITTKFIAILDFMILTV